MNCPNCGSDCWDNTAKVAGGWKGPLHKCKDKACDWVLWPPKPEKKKAAPTANGNGAKWASWRELAEVYHESLLIARKQVLALSAATKLPVTMADVIAAGATVFITAARDGVKKVPAPQPLEEKPAALQPAGDDDLPFD